MPEELERKLRLQGRKKGLAGDRLDAYVYGTMMEKTSWRPKRKKTKNQKHKKK